MGEIFALAVKDLRVALRDKAGLFFLFCFPVMVAIFFGFIFSGVAGDPTERKITIALVDEDKTEGSIAFADGLIAAEELEVWAQKSADDTTPLTRSDVEEMVKKGRVPAYIILPEGFGEARENMFWQEPAAVEVGSDPSRTAEAAMLKGILLKQVFEGMKDQFSGGGKMRERLREGMAEMEGLPGATGLTKDWAESLGKLDAALVEIEELRAQEGGEGVEWSMSEPLRIEASTIERDREGRPMSPFQITFPQGMIWGLLGTAATFGISLVVERVRGTLVRLRMSPISRAHILAGKGLACFIAMMMVVLSLMLIGLIPWFRVRPSSVPLLILAAGCSGFSFVGLMMFVSTLGKTERAAGGFGWAFMLVLAMTGGASMPLAFMPPWMQAVSKFSPVRWAIYSLEGAIWRGLSFADLVVPCLVLLGSGAAFFVIGVAMFSWSD